MLVALVAVVSLGAIEFTQDSGEERLEGRATSAGAPDVNAGLPPAPTTTTTIVSGGSGGAGSGPTVAPSASFTFTTSAQSGNKWTASVTITLVNPANGNAAVPGAVVTGSWTPSDGGQTTCTTNGSGQCTVTQPNMSTKGGNAVAAVTFGVADVTGPDIDYTQAPPSTPTIPAP